MAKKNKVEMVEDSEITKVTIEIGKQFVDFIKEYLTFVGSSDTVADYFRDAVFDRLVDLQDCFRAIPEFDPEGFEKKHPQIAMLLNP